MLQWAAEGGRGGENAAPLGQPDLSPSSRGDSLPVVGRTGRKRAALSGAKLPLSVGRKGAQNWPDGQEN